MLSTESILYQGINENGMYPFHCTISDKVQALFSAKTSPKVWHRGHGHPSFSSFNKLCKDFHLHDTSSKPLFCKECQLSRSHKQPFKLYDSVSTQPLELLHMDVWCLAPISYFSGYRCYVNIIGDHSNFCWIYPLSVKYEFHTIFIFFIHYIVRLLDIR